MPVKKKKLEGRTATAGKCILLSWQCTNPVCVLTVYSLEIYTIKRFKIKICSDVNVTCKGNVWLKIEVHRTYSVGLEDLKDFPHLCIFTLTRILIHASLQAILFRRDVDVCMLLILLPCRGERAQYDSDDWQVCELHRQALLFFIYLS